MRSGIPPWLVFLSSLLLPNALYAAPDSNEKDLGQLRDRIENLQKYLADKEESKSELSDALHKSEQAIEGINQKLNNLKEERHKVKNKLSQLQDELDVTQNKILDQQTYLGKLLYQQYIGGKYEFIRLLLDQKDPNQISRELYYYGYISRTRAEDINILRADLERLRTIVDEADKKTTEIISIQTKQAGQKEILEQEEIKYKELLARISKEVAKGQRKIRKLQNDERRLSRLINKIGNRKDRSEKRNKENLPDASLDKEEFKKLKGQLNLPINGEIVNSFGSPRSKGGVTWKGLFIRASVGIDVKAIADGQVVFADWLRGFGNILIVDHGGDYMSLYGNNKILAKKVGETIHGGDIIATVGNSGGNLNSGLYFELRHKGKPFDPLKWIRLK
jgi:septal ring factor EnvC (AmiA/AmiB activator)